MEVVPLPEGAFLFFDDQRALAGEHEEPFLAGLGVVERVRLAGGEDAHVDAEVAEPRVAGFERVDRAALLLVAHGERLRRG